MATPSQRLGIDRHDGITDEEIAMMDRLITRMRTHLGDMADELEAHDTLEGFKAIGTVVRFMSRASVTNKSVDEIVALAQQIVTGQVGTTTPAALTPGTGTGSTAPESEQTLAWVADTANTLGMDIPGAMALLGLLVNSIPPGVRVDKVRSGQRQQELLLVAERGLPKWSDDPTAKAELKQRDDQITDLKSQLAAAAQASAKLDTVCMALGIAPALVAHATPDDLKNAFEAEKEKATKPLVATISVLEGKLADVKPVVEAYASGRRSKIGGSSDWVVTSPASPEAVTKAKAAMS